LLDDLMALVDKDTGGDPMTTIKYARRSLRQLARELADWGHAAAPTTVAELLRECDYALHVNVKRFTGPAHAERDAQFHSLQDWIELFTEESLPIISVDSKKKELIGNFANAGSAWSLAGDEVNAHDFRQDASYRAVPYGIYDYLSNRGHVVIGTSADTPAFAVDAIVQWWRRQGACRYAHAEHLLILADAGGSNGCRPRLWKHALQTRLADPFGLTLVVCHYPPGASKWNPVEHRLFGPISTNWAAIPLRNLDIMQACLRGTTTQTGLKVTSQLHRRLYRTGTKISAAQMSQLDIHYHESRPQWNYSIYPRSLETLN
jgi:hypothetical protein